MERQSMTLNIRYDLPNGVWENTIPKIYESMEGWVGFVKSDENDSIPYWFNTDEQQKHIWASVEPSGLLFEGRMTDAEWKEWKLKIKKIATQKLGFKVGEIELGEVD
ncbi:hypothetical protein [Bernardetia sp.]|uniref:hypothetical protein n=1 Tax=Bernardetia sp. TaxID=1937974 RepID=UPI0025C0560B|nr:hypothetical protein [Bernardetia sp.]